MFGTIASCYYLQMIQVTTKLTRSYLNYINSKFL